MADKPLCSIPGCDKHVRCRGMCSTHYSRMRELRMEPCEIEGCKRRAVTRRLCDKHYRRLLNTAGRIENPDRGCAVPGCSRPHGSLGYCERHYGRFKRHGDPTAGIADQGAGLAFIEQVLAAPPTTECIPWHKPFRGSSRAAYPRVYAEGKGWQANRYICYRRFGPRSSEIEACHSCANKWCVNPEHLRWGTAADNGADRSLHGTVCRGVEQWKSKLTEDDVRAIRAAPANTSLADLGRQYGVSGENIRFIRLRKTWKHVA